MAGKLHCVKNQGRTDKFCSRTHLEVSVLRCSSSCVCSVKKLTEIAWKVSKTKENKRLFLKLRYSSLQTGSRLSIQPRPVVGGETGFFCFIRVGEAANVSKICYIFRVDAAWHTVFNCCTKCSTGQPRERLKQVTEVRIQRQSVSF